MMPDEFDWAAHTEAVVVDIFGEPNAEMSRPPEDVRFGNHGSVSVNYTTGQWFDFENERGGGIKELIRIYKAIDDCDAAIAYAEECQQNFENGEKPRQNGKPEAGQHYQREREATYSYHDASGQVAFEAVRFVLKQVGGGYVNDERGKRMKTFSQRERPTEAGCGASTPVSSCGSAPGKDWISFNATKFDQYPAATRQRKVFNIAAPVVPYQLPELLKAVAAGQTICIAEGEKKVDLHSQLRLSRDLLCRGCEQVELRAQRIPAERRRRAAAR
jgi:hypothetical protein